MTIAEQLRTEGMEKGKAEKLLMRLLLGMLKEGISS